MPNGAIPVDPFDDPFDLSGLRPEASNEVVEAEKEETITDKYHLQNFLKEKLRCATTKEVVRKLSMMEANQDNPEGLLNSLKYYDEKIKVEVPKRPVFDTLKSSFFSLYRGTITRGAYTGFEGVVLRFEMKSNNLDNYEMGRLIEYIIDDRLVWNEDVMYYFIPKYRRAFENCYDYWRGIKRMTDVEMVNFKGSESPKRFARTRGWSLLYKDVFSRNTSTNASGYKMGYDIAKSMKRTKLNSYILAPTRYMHAIVDPKFFILKSKFFNAHIPDPKTNKDTINKILSSFSFTPRRYSKDNVVFSRDISTNERLRGYISYLGKGFKKTDQTNEASKFERDDGGFIYIRRLNKSEIENNINY